jgi:mRNA interferase MazF
MKMRVNNNCTEEIKCGDVFFADLSGEGSLQTGLRPVIVVSNDTGNYFSSVVTVVPLTSKKKKELPTHTTLHPNAINGLNKISVALAEQITTIPQDYLVRKIGCLNNKEINNVRFAVLNMLSMSCLAKVAYDKKKTNLVTKVA